MKISTVIPVYNEADNVSELTKRLERTFMKLGCDFEFNYVVQGKDGAREILLKLKKNIPTIRMKYFPRPIGVGSAFRIGFDMISKDSTHVLTMDGDLNHQPEELPSFVSKMEETNCDIVIGSRKVAGGTMIQMPFYKKVISGFTNIVLKSIFNIGVRDLTSGYRLFKRDAITRIRKKITSKNFEVYPEILLLAKRKGFSMVEIPIKFKYRIHGKSKLNFFTSGIGYVRLILRIL